VLIVLKNAEPKTVPLVAIPHGGPRGTYLDQYGMLTAILAANGQF
jgi:dipeptidyl aminopeptidase/acylaminoacyl peptidase